MQIKKDPFVIGLAAVVVLVLGGLTWHGDISWKEALGGLVLLGIPSLLGKPS